VDYGPSRTIHGLDAIREVEVESDRSRISIDFEFFNGLYYVATSPPLVPITIDVELPAGHATPIVFIGPMQLPLEVLGRRLDPRQDFRLYGSQAIPLFRTSPRPAIRYWWQPYPESSIKPR
jgi:hypothetical protein